MIYSHLTGKMEEAVHVISWDQTKEDQFGAESVGTGGEDMSRCYGRCLPETIQTPQTRERQTRYSAGGHWRKSVPATSPGMPDQQCMDPITDKLSARRRAGNDELRREWMGA